MRLANERVPDLPRALWVVQAGTAVSRRVRYDRADPGACVVERIDYDAARSRFTLAARHALPLDRAAG